MQDASKNLDCGSKNKSFGNKLDYLVHNGLLFLEFYIVDDLN